MAPGLTTNVRLQVSEDRLRVTLIPARNDPAQLTSEAIVAALGELSVQLPEGFTQKLEKMLSTVQPRSNEAVVLVEGRAPVAGVGVVFRPLAHEDAGATDHGGQSAWHRSTVITAGPGECIGTLTQAVAPADGCDVFGKPILALWGASIRLGKNVRLDADGRSVIATTAGRVRLVHDELSVVEVVDIEGDVDYSTGNVHAPSDIVIKGTVRESFEVLGKQSVSIKGTVEAAIIQAAMDVHVQGGITAHGKGRVVAGGTIAARFCDAADLRGWRRGHPARGVQ